ncbi:MAG: AIPR family protein [Epsilonproteobacteria bacterium]|nr:AIPR family protein [Campylobacterota bacterium]
MNRRLFIDSYIARIQQKFSLQPNFAFEILVLAAFLDLSFDEVFHHVSTIENGNGGHDGGVDGIYIEEDDENVLHIFQIKNQPYIGDNEIAKFVNDFRSLFVFDNASSLPLNSKVTTALQKYKEIVISGKVVETKLYFVFAGEKISQNRAIIDRHEQGNENLKIYDMNDLYDQIDLLVSETKKRKSVTFSFMAEKSNVSLRSDPQALISFSIQNVKAVNFRFSAIELCKLLDTEKTINKRIDTIFSDNIRGFLSYNKTNKNIKNTLMSTEAEYFPFLNNGITIIAEQVKIPKEMQSGFYPLEVKNPVIVNGLQTTHVIYDIYKHDASKLDGVYVLVRLYETTDSELIDKITDATNTQSPINYRDKISNRKFNAYAKAVFENAGVGYLDKRGETFDNKLSVELSKSVHNETVLKYWYATYFEQPETAKGSKSKILEELFDATTNENNNLHTLFSGNKNSPIYEQMLIAYRLYDFIITQREQIGAIDDFIYFADELIAYGVYKLMDKNCDFSLGTIPNLYPQVYDAIKRAVQKEKANKESHSLTYSHNSYFKSAKSRFDLNRELQLFEKNSLFFSSGNC